jgi:hypothetical protein
MGKGDLGTRQKNQNFDGLGLEITILYFLALSPISLNTVLLVKIKI